ncbi:hypothetical protein AA106555_0712 [Neokomagataea thailandica NBRC 106555]|uniref:Uncharacterized protein n=2 Tax=Neokomagataea thailandica TaxID=661190 RepID=A0ABQ0QNX0_9PROT|nr:hypothetical protein AA106555_0712 [Neokomagataea thailandica NBRC 106555]
MVEHYDVLKEATVGKRVRWNKMCEAAIKDGLMTFHGTPPKPQTLRLTWYRVRLKMEREAQAREEKLAERRRKRDEETTRRLALQEKAKEAMDAFEAKRRAAAAHDPSIIVYERPQNQAEWIPPQFTPPPSLPVFQPVTAPASPSPTSAAEPPAVVPAASSTAHLDVLANAKQPVKMMTQARLYGLKIDIPPPYEGPRPVGMPDYLPLDAITPLNYPVYDDNGKINVEQLPGFPRRSFFENEREWGRSMKAMVGVIPPKDRTNLLRSVYAYASAAAS